ncbi:MAG: hypothetical protein ACM3ZQ_00350 [Bacillota bacterium]
MRRTTARDRVRSYFSAVSALAMVIFGLLRLPRVGYTTIGGAFTIVWLGFALLIIASHLRILAQESAVADSVAQLSRVEQKRGLKRRAPQS